MIKVNELSYSYPDSDVQTIKNISFEVEEGEIFGFLGPSGAGKSTTQKIVNGILKNFKGQVNVLGQDLNKINNKFYEEIGVAFEFPNLYPKLTASENLKFFGSLYQKKVLSPEEMLEMVNLKDDADVIVENFSKGMKVRLNFIRALQHNPELLFLDEPTSGLDPANQKLVKDIIREQKKAGKTIFLTTHNMNVADELCDRVAFIVDGQLKNVDSPRSLKLKYSQKQVSVEYRKENAVEKRLFDLDNLHTDKDFQQILKLNTVETIHTTEATLEDVFIASTGRSLS